MGESEYITADDIWKDIIKIKNEFDKKLEELWRMFQNAKKRNN